MTNTLTDKSNNPDMQKQQDDTNAPNTAEKKRISILANKFAKRARERQLRHDGRHTIFTK